MRLHAGGHSLTMRIQHPRIRRGAGDSLAQAARVAGIDRIRFQHLLASRSIPVNYDAREFESDRKTVDSMP